MNIRDTYEASLGHQGHVRDASQEKIVAALAELQQQLERGVGERAGFFSRLFRTTNAKPARGLYIWGGVGRGKTYLMDLFFEAVEIEAKRRVHFHRMLQDVHRRLKTLGDIEDPLLAVAESIADESRLLCFDEFFVSDIGDAMILGRLLDGLFERGVTLVTTSNSPPDQLYKDGLQRQRFLPAIEALNRYTRVINMDGEMDYRLRLLQQAGTYLLTDDQDTESRLSHLFSESASSQVMSSHVLDINGREIRATRCAKGIVWFDFDEICDGPRSQMDYIEIARWYPTVIVTGVPELDSKRDDQARRFISMVDEFYDRRVKLIVSATREPEGLYSGHRLEFEFDRTISRLVEMQSTDYLHLPHLA